MLAALAICDALRALTVWELTSAFVVGAVMVLRHAMPIEGMAREVLSAGVFVLVIRVCLPREAVG